MEEEAKAAWVRRAGVVGRAQARYLWLLFIAGLFYLALDSQVDPAQSDATGELVVPFVDLTLGAAPVWASAPAVLGMLLLALHGTLRAYKSAAKALSVEKFGLGEEFDLAPNALDFVAYTTSDSPRWIRAILLFVYPGYMALLCGEAWWLWLKLLDAEAVRGRVFFLVVGLIAVGFASWRVLSYGWSNGRRALKVARGQDDV